MEMRGLLGFCIILSCCATAAHAKLFSNAYVSFELPPNWNCNLEGTEWVCVNQFEQHSKEAIIILTAKEVGPTDTIAAYQAHLEAPRNVIGPDGKPTMSKIISVKQRQIAGHLWVDGMHLGSEVGPYYTRYLATIKERIAILVTFSAHKLHYTKYSSDFLKAVESLRVIAGKDFLDDKPVMAKGGGAGGVGSPIGNAIPVDLTSDQAPAEDSTFLGNNGSKIFGALLLLSAAIIYFFFKSSNKRRKRRPPPTKPRKK
jgi:hypothetical protein